MSKLYIADPWDLAAIVAKPAYLTLSREQIAASIEHLYRLWYGDAPEYGGTCLHWTHAACCVLRLCGKRAILQAGDMNWPLTRDPDARTTHFSYEWQPTEALSVARIAIGGLPEVHVWCALPDEGELVDFSTREFRRVAENTHGLRWEYDDPPAYLWCKGTDLPHRVYYTPKIEAIRFVCNFLSREERNTPATLNKKGRDNAPVGSGPSNLNELGGERRHQV